MKLVYTFVIAAAILLGFLALSSTVSLNGRYVRYGDTQMVLDTRTGDVFTINLVDSPRPTPGDTLPHHVFSLQHMYDHDAE